MGQFKGFSSVQLKTPKRSSFDLSHTRRTTTMMSILTPILVQECIPSDKFNGSSEVLMRLAPLLAPLYDGIELYVHYFFVPNRLLWDEWETFITGGRLGVGIDPVTAPVPPCIDLGAYFAAVGGGFGKDSLGDHLGLPNFLSIEPTISEWDGVTVDIMPFAAYQLIWKEYYRDRNFIADDVVELPLASGVMPVAEFTDYANIRNRNYPHGYFTSALPFTQRGEEVLMPVQLEGLAPLYTEKIATVGEPSLIKGMQDGTDVAWGSVLVDPPPAGMPSGGIWVDGKDFSGASTTINDFRSAYALQVWLERNAVGGSRYTESTQAHFNVRPQDMRLQRPEYIGGGRIPVRISEVVSTAWATDASDVSIPQASLSGYGVTYGNTNNFSYFCVEHGFIMGIASIMSTLSYQQGLPKMFRRRSFLDYPWPTFAKLGEQPINDHEIYATPASLTEDSDGELPVFGYTSRYADWKWMCSTNHGDFKESLLYWTFTQVYTSAPVLSASFLEAFWDESRVFAAPSSGNYLLLVHNKVFVKRPLPYFGTPNTLNFG